MFKGCKSKKIRVFLSHNWGKDAAVHLKVKKIYEMLSNNSDLEVWFDETHLKGNIPLAMANGIDSSDVFLVFVTAEYMDKVASGKHQDNVFREFNYAQETMGQDRLIPIKFENIQRKWWGPVGMILGSTLYIDMSKEFIPNSSYYQLISTIKSRGVRPQKLLNGAIQKVMDMNKAIKLEDRMNGNPDSPPEHNTDMKQDEDDDATKTGPKSTVRQRASVIAHELSIEESNIRDIIEKAMETLKITHVNGMVFNDKLEAVEKHLCI